MADDFRGRVCILTGATGGIGAALAKALAADGLRLALVARRAAELEALAAELVAAGGEARAFPTDLLDPAATAAMVEAVRAELGPVAVLVNNAGVETFQHFHEADTGGIGRAVALNVTAPLVLTRLVLPDMLSAHGVVVNLASTAGLFGTPNGAVYSATKAAVIAANRSLRMEYAGRPVRFTAVSPGFVHGAGMHEVHKQEVGAAPAALGGTTVAAVVRAVQSAIRKDRAEIIVNSSPLRPLIAVANLLPGFGVAATGKLAGGYMRAIADARRGDG
jgi:short-subunit dehydrogenase